jgi:stearoyl-CoA desaturase (delta-9 desaturase)
MDAWTSFSWTGVALGALLGFVVCELNQYLTSAVLHRGLCHGAIRYPAWFNRTVAGWLWLTACVPPLTWIAAHRHHHANSDTEDDPHAPCEKGVWSVMLLTWYYVTRWAREHRRFAEERYLRAFRDERFLRLLDGKAASYANFYLQLGLSLLAGPAWLAFWFARIVPYMLLSGYVNAVGHTWGERPYRNLGTDAAGPLLTCLAYLMGGEPLGHNYHHRHPSSPTFRPRRFDPGYWFAVRVLRGTPIRPSPLPPGFEEPAEATA